MQTGIVWKLQNISLIDLKAPRLPYVPDPKKPKTSALQNKGPKVRLN